MCRWVFTLLLMLAFAPSFAEQTLRIAVATTAEETGLVSYLVQEFRKTNPDVNVTLTVTGAINALQIARNGSVDAVITHHPTSEPCLLPKATA